MKLINLITEKHETHNDKDSNAILSNCPNIYIRATLPEHWRVEGYDKSWEWACVEWEKNFEGLYTEWEVVAYNKAGMGSLALNAPKLDEISRAEFEYHIYNPWKQGQEQLDMSDLDTLKQQAEKMGYKLVKKTIEWKHNSNKCTICKDGLQITNDKETTFIGTELLDTLIEKYNQFKNI